MIITSMGCLYDMYVDTLIFYLGTKLAYVVKNSLKSVYFNGILELLF